MPAANSKGLVGHVSVRTWELDTLNSNWKIGARFLIPRGLASKMELMSAGPRVIFFCGHKSPYGFGHLEPILKEFTVIAVVVATDERWAYFGKTLSGGASPLEPPLLWADIEPSKIARHVRDRIHRWVGGAIGLRNICLRSHVPIWYTGDVNSPQFIQKVSQQSPEVLLCAAFPQLFGHDLLASASRGGVNFHPALLPRFRGAHPHFWAIARGESEGGMTAHIMTERLDGGPIIAQARFPIAGMYYSDYYRALLGRIPEFVNEVKEFIICDRLPEPQIGHSVLFHNDCEINHRVFWDIMTASEIHNLIRTERAFCTFRDRRIWIHRADCLSNTRNMCSHASAEPGTIVGFDESRIILAAREGGIAITSLSFGRRKMPSRSWADRNKVQIGQRFR